MMNMKQLMHLAKLTTTYGMLKMEYLYGSAKNDNFWLFIKADIVVDDRTGVCALYVDRLVVLSIVWKMDRQLWSSYDIVFW